MAETGAAMRSSAFWRGLSRLRYALPDHAGRLFPGPDADGLARIGRCLDRRGWAMTIGFFDTGSDRPEAIVAAYEAAMALGGALPEQGRFAIKAPPLGFGEAHFLRLAERAAGHGHALIFDAHGPEDADRTLEAVERLLPVFPDTGCVLPARWRRSRADALRFRDSMAPVRIVKGEWPDPAGESGDRDEDYLALVALLAGRAASVGVATHKPALAERALSMLREAGTPCELEQIRGLPRRRTVAAARRLGVPVRLYVPFGPGWTPYAVEAALARPYMLRWMARDMLGLRDPR